MGKKKAKTAALDTPDAWKDAGNKAFSANKFDEAIGLYTSAIDMP